MKAPISQPGTVSFTTTRVETPVGPAVRAAMEIEGGITSPGQFADAVGGLELAQTVPGMDVIFEGAGPIWGYAMPCHAAHKFAWVATYDPRHMAGIVVQSHWPGVQTGAVISLDIPDGSRP